MPHRNQPHDRGQLSCAHLLVWLVWCRAGAVCLSWRCVWPRPAPPDVRCSQLKAACTERHQLTTGNKAHLRHRLLRLCRHVPWATPPPPGGTRAERAAGSFHAPGHADYGVNEFIVDPRDPDHIVASSWQRRRHVWTLIDGGPGSGIHVTRDGGKTWKRVSAGLPKDHMGRIGLAMAPSAPDTLYAVIEAGDKEKGFYRSTDFGQNWHKRSDFVAGSPQYYNEIIVDPHEPGWQCGDGSQRREFCCTAMAALVARHSVLEHSCRPEPAVVVARARARRAR